MVRSSVSRFLSQVRGKRGPSCRDAPLLKPSFLSCPSISQAKFLITSPGPADSFLGARPSILLLQQVRRLCSQGIDGAFTQQTPEENARLILCYLYQHGFVGRPVGMLQNGIKVQGQRA